MSYYSKASQGGGHGAGGYDDDQGYDMQNIGNNGGYRDDPNSYGSQYPMAGNSNASAASPYGYQSPPKKRNKWLWIGLPVLAVIIIVGAVVGGVVGSRASKDDNNSNGSSSGSNEGAATTALDTIVGTNSAGAGVGGTATGADGQNYLAVSTDSQYLLPVYPTGTATSGYSAPTSRPSSSVAWPSDPDSPSSSSPRAHPRIIAPAYKWEALRSNLIANDPYLKFWNETLVNNATSLLSTDPVEYAIDGGLSASGVLDVAREMKVRVKQLAYAYQMTNDTQFAERAWLELSTGAGNTSTSFGDGVTRWNPDHFLDLAEFCATFAVGYDWLYSWLSDQQKAYMRDWIVTFGLNYGEAALNGDASASTYNWWANLGNGAPVAGNWNCVINGGLTLAALAIQGDDTTGVATSVLQKTIPNAQANCFEAVRTDGTWAETSDYWYFGTTGAAEMVGALISAYGSDQGILAAAPQWNLTSLFHIYNQGMTSKFNYGDHGPNKYSATANSLFLWADQFDQPRYALYQRDRVDAADPWSMFWYNPAYEGAWWDGLPLDRHFDDSRDDWASMRSTWTDNDGVFAAMRAGELTGHQTHGDLDIGDFVIDALGQRWVGEYGSAQYLSDNYFSNETQSSERWYYYRKRTEGQNTLMLNYENQLVTANCNTSFGSTGEAQGPAPGYTPPSGSSAYYTADMSSAYSSGTFQRGIRLVNSRLQVFLQDDVSGTTEDVQWRVQTNATINLDSAATTATLELDGQSLTARILNPTSGATFSVLQPVNLNQDPVQPPDFTYNGVTYPNDPDNSPASVLAVTMTGGGTFSLQVLFTPQYPSGVNTVTSVPNIPVTEWTDTSHNA